MGPHPTLFPCAVALKAPKGHAKKGQQTTQPHNIGQQLHYGHALREERGGVGTALLAESVMQGVGAAVPVSEPVGMPVTVGLGVEGRVPLLD